MQRHWRQELDQIERWMLKGEKIPHEERVFSIFEEQTRGCAKGNLGRTAELEVPVAPVESKRQFVLPRQVIWDEQGEDLPCPLVRATQASLPLRGP